LKPLLQLSYSTVSDCENILKIIKSGSNGSEIDPADSGSLPLSVDSVVVNNQWAMSWVGV